MFTKLYLIALPAFLAIDAVWLGLISKSFYRSQIGSLMKANVNWAAALTLYALLVAGLVIFAISPAIEKGSLVHALIFGGLFGLVAYATYDLTNLAIAKDWPLLVTIVDIAWGTAISAVVSAITYQIATRM